MDVSVRGVHMPMFLRNNVLGEKEFQTSSSAWLLLLMLSLCETNGMNTQYSHCRVQFLLP
jgi:hypothetical protein